MPQIGLISHQHDDNVAVSMIPEFLQPSRDILKCLVLADIIHKQGSDCTTVVSGCDGAVSFLSSSIPDLGFDGLGVDLDAAGRKLYADCGLAVEIEFVAGESREKVGFSDARVTDENHWRLEMLLAQSVHVIAMVIICMQAMSPSQRGS
jgi:hypothetical protein